MRYFIIRVNDDPEQWYVFYGNPEVPGNRLVAKFRLKTDAEDYIALKRPVSYNLCNLELAS